MEKLLFIKRRKNMRKKTLTLESSKTLGIVGAILTLIGPFGILGVPYLLVLSLVGVILILVSLYGLANIYQEKGIFNNSLYGFIMGIVGLVVAAVVVAIAFFSYLNDLKSFLLQLYPTWDGKWSDAGSLRGMSPHTSGLNLTVIRPFLELVLVALVIFWVFLILWAFFARKSLKTLAEKSGTGLFGTASLVLIIGAALTIVGIGLILLWVGVLLVAIAFFQLKPQTEQPPATYAAPPMTPTPV
jgi:uncharacterized membrane protein